MSATTEGRGGIIMMAALTSIDRPDQWDWAAQTGTASYGDTLVAVMCRAGLLAGETTWPFFTKGGGDASWAWIAEEWTNLSFAPLPVLGAGSGMLVGPSSISTGAVGPWDSMEYVVGVAALCVVGSAGATSGWSAVTW